MRDFDAHVIEACRVPGLLLMENAGRGAADVIEREALGGAARGKRVVVVCGTGNNGGDGYVVARHLAGRGAELRVLAMGDRARLRGDAKVNHDAWVGVGGQVGAIEGLDAALAGADAVVDALFGTGLDRPVVGESVEVLKAMSRSGPKRVAIDLPSGVDADTGDTMGAAFVADLTVTFAHPKQGLLTPRGMRATGPLHVVDLGVPGDLGPARTTQSHAFERCDAIRLAVPRTLDAHKHSAGHVAVLGGSDGKIGAALMVARAALRAGAGLATITSWPEAAEIARGRVLEEMVAVIERGAGRDASLDAALGGKRVAVVGPGFGLDDDAKAAVAAVVARWGGPAVYDADALTHLAANPESLAACKVPPVLTPHAGEAARLLATKSAAIEADRWASARALAAKTRAVVVLKGACTLVADPSGRVVVHPVAHPVLATAGSGDTLGGLLGAFLCTLDPFDAACLAVFVHGAAAAAWSEAHGDRGLLASEIADGVPDVLAALTREHAARRP
jgi:NAD(P)H-hydrate epimerase